MRDERKTKAQLITELQTLRQQVAQSQSPTCPHDTADQEAVSALGGSTADTQKRTEPHLSEGESTYRSLVEKLPVITYTYSPESPLTKLFISPQVVNITGYSAATIMSSPHFWIDHIHPDDQQRVLSELTNSQEQGTIFQSEYRWLARNNEVLWFRDEASFVSEGVGRPLTLHGVAFDITEKKRAEEALQQVNIELEQRVEQRTAQLQQAEEHYRSIFEHAVVGIFQTTLEGHYLDVNPALAQMLGFASPIDLMTQVQNVGDLYVTPSQRQEISQLLNQNGSITDFEVQVYRQDRSIIWITINVRLVRDAQGVALFYEGMVQDITERKQMEKDLRASEERFRSLSDASPVGIYYNEARGSCLYVNERIQEIMGYSSEDILANNWLNGVHLEDRQRVWDAWTRAMQGGQPFACEYRFVRPNDEERWVYSQSTPMYGHAGEIIGHAGTIEDITERKLADTALRESEERYRSLVELCPFGIYIHADGKIIYANKAYVHLLGATSSDELLGREFTEFIPPSYPDKLQKRIRRVLEQDDPVSPLEQQGIRLDGSVIDVEAISGPVVYQGKPAVQVVARDISERKQSEEALRASEERFRSLSDSAPIGIFQTDANGAGVYTNPRWQEIAGVELADTLGLEWVETIIEEDRQEVLDEYVRCASEGREFSKEFRIRRPNGELRWVHSRAATMHSSRGELLGHVGTTEDITERKHMEEALRDSRQRYTEIFENTSDAIFVIGVQPNNTFVYEEFNPMEEKLTELSSEAVCGKTPEEVLRPDMAAEVTANYRRCLEADAPITYEETFTFETRTNTVQTLLVPVRDATGKVKRIAGIARDCTEQRRAAEALRASEERFALAIQGTDDGLWDWRNLSTQDLYYAPRFKELLGYVDAEFPNLFDTFVEHLHPDDRSRVLQSTWEHLEQRTPYDIEYRLRTKDGAYRWFSSRGQAIWDTLGTPHRMVGSIRDITSRKNLENELREARDNLEGIVTERTLELRQTNEALRLEVQNHQQTERALRQSEERYRMVSVSVSDYAFAFVFANGVSYVDWLTDGFPAVTGYAVEELIGVPDGWKIFIHPEDVERVTAIISDLASDALVSFEFRIFKKNGEERWLRARVRALRDDQHQLRRTFGAVRDITESKKIELQLRESEKLIATGRMAAGIAHEINNPLAGIKYGLQLLQAGIAEDYPYAHYVPRIDKELSRITTIVKQMYDLYRPQQDKQQLFILDDVLRDIRSLLEPKTQAANITIHMDVVPPARKVRLAENSLRQVLFNLIQNAIEASPAEERVIVEARYIEQQLSISVSDRGHGVPSEARSRIFEPFFTTKENGSRTGMGLGLSVSHSLVQSMGGAISFRDNEPRGSIFHITLPSGE